MYEYKSTGIQGDYREAKERYIPMPEPKNHDEKFNAFVAIFVL